MERNLKNLFGSVTGLDEKSLEFLTLALEKSNLPGFDYIEYKQSLAALTEMNLEEATAFKSSFVTAATMGLTKAKLLESGEHYKGVLRKEKDQFDVALQNQTKQKVDSKVQEIAALKSDMERFKNQIIDLENKILEAQKTVDGADEIIKIEKEKIEKNQTNFENTYQSILNQMNKDLENINKYL